MRSCRSVFAEWLPVLVCNTHVHQGYTVQLSKSHKGSPRAAGTSAGRAEGFTLPHMAGRTLFSKGDSWEVFLSHSPVAEAGCCLSLSSPLRCLPSSPRDNKSIHCVQASLAVATAPEFSYELCGLGQCPSRPPTADSCLLGAEGFLENRASCHH